jgi:hypothetical protein
MPQSAIKRPANGRLERGAIGSVMAGAGLLLGRVGAVLVLIAAGSVGASDVSVGVGASVIVSVAVRVEGTESEEGNGNAVFPRAP